MFQSRVAVVEGHNKDSQTDHLYEPLRKTFLVDTTAKKDLMAEASKVSQISHVVRTGTYAQNYTLGTKTFIPEDVRLKPSQDQRIPANSNYRIVNTEKRQLNPISAEELEQRVRNKHEQVIVYTYGDNKPPIQPEREVPQKEVLPLESHRLRTSGIKVTQPKYNLFSIIDEPVHSLFSGGPCMCPANQIVAGQRSELRWNDVNNYDGD